MGVSHPAIEAVCRITADCGLHSKLTGAGGGGCVLTLYSPDCKFHAHVGLHRRTCRILHIKCFIGYKKTLSGTGNFGAETLNLCARSTHYLAETLNLWFGVWHCFVIMATEIKFKQDDIQQVYMGYLFDCSLLHDRM